LDLQELVVLLMSLEELVVAVLGPEQLVQQLVQQVQVVPLFVALLVLAVHLYLVARLLLVHLAYYF
jgi:hypothetical protein